MKSRKLIKIISGAVLLYFALFIIPPVSTFAAPQKAIPATEGRYSLEQDHRQTRLYLVDILLWFSLEQTRRSDAASFSPLDQAASPAHSDLDDIILALPPDQHARIIWSARALQHAISGHLSRTAEIFFARSGISPPHLS